LQNIEQFFTPDTYKAVAARTNDAAFEMQLDVVPVVEGLLDFGADSRSHCCI